jgi:hypothetical protein
MTYKREMGGAVLYIRVATAIADEAAYQPRHCLEYCQQQAWPVIGLAIDCRVPDARPTTDNSDQGAG